MCGFLNVSGITLLFVSFEEAIKSNNNLGVCSAMLSGTILLGLLGSKIIYKENITPIQIAGSLVLMISISTVAIMSDARYAETATSSGLMIFYALMAMTCLGIRAVTSKYCCNIVGTLTFTMIGFYADFIIGLVYVALWLLGLCSFIEMNWTVEVVLVISGVSVACVLADFLFFKSMAEGIVGVAVAIVASNFVVVTGLSFLIAGENGAKMTLMQGIGIILSVFGIIIVTAGDLCVGKKEDAKGT